MLPYPIGCQMAVSLVARTEPERYGFDPVPVSALSEMVRRENHAECETGA